MHTVTHGVILVNFTNKMDKEVSIHTKYFCVATVFALLRMLQQQICLYFIVLSVLDQHEVAHNCLVKRKNTVSSPPE